MSPVGIDGRFGSGIWQMNTTRLWKQDTSGYDADSDDVGCSLVGLLVIAVFDRCLSQGN